MRIPSGLDWWSAEPGGAEWLARLPRLAAECAEQWSLRLEAPFEPAHISLVVPAGEAVLKLNFPEAESEHEADALAHWDGDAAVRLLAHDPARRALLVERCRPGTKLWELSEEDATAIAAGVAHRRLRPAPENGVFRPLSVEAERWAREVPGAAAAVRELGPVADAVVVDQDFHGGNVLLSERGWLAIDPKPLLGEPEFGLVSLVRDRRQELTPAIVRRRLDRLSGELGLDRERLRLWSIVHALAWDHPEVAHMIAFDVR